MAMITKEITIDVSRTSVFQTIVAKQHDSNSRFLKVVITNDGVPLSIDTSSTVIIDGKRKDGESKAFRGTINGDGTVTVPLTGWLLELNGIVKCDITIVDIEGRKLSTVLFYLAVEEAVYDGSEISEDENYDLMVELLSEVAKAKADVEEILLEVGNATSLANDKALLADNAAKEAESAARKANDAADGITAIVNQEIDALRKELHDDYVSNDDLKEKIVIDTEMSDTSDNAVKNKVIKRYIDDKTLTELDIVEIIRANTQQSITGDNTLPPSVEAMLAYIDSYCSVYGYDIIALREEMYANYTTKESYNSHDMRIENLEIYKRDEIEPTFNAVIGDLNNIHEEMGNVDTALDIILAIHGELIGGDA